MELEKKRRLSLPKKLVIGGGEPRCEINGVFYPYENAVNVEILIDERTETKVIIEVLEDIFNRVLEYYKKME